MVAPFNMSSLDALRHICLFNLWNLLGGRKREKGTCKGEIHSPQ